VVGRDETGGMLAAGMAKKTTKRPKAFVDPNALEFFREMGQKGGQKGGKARWEGVPPEERSEIARRAVRARWRKQRRNKVAVRPKMKPGT